MKRSEILDAAKGHITKDRAATHGNAESNFQTVAEFWNVWLGDRLNAPLTNHDAAMMLALFKDARVKGNPTHRDSYEDGVGYRAIAAEIAMSAGSTSIMPGVTIPEAVAGITRAAEAIRTPTEPPLLREAWAGRDGEDRQ
jgi:hypothetical protein